jgi:redox-sensitive bicupin YhaK (pirin superfamily)
MTAPRYQDIPPERVPEVELGPGARARVVAGAAGGAEGPVSGVATQPVYLDLRLAAGASLQADVTPGHNAFAYVYEGDARLGDDGTPVASKHLAVLDPEGDSVLVRAGDAGARLLLVAGRPIGEPVARYGPFVMNTREEILEAVEDFRAGRLA